MLRLLFAGLAVALLTACSGSDDDDNSTADASSSEARNVARVPMDREMEALSKLQVPGYASSDAGLSLLGAGMTYVSNSTTQTGAQIQVLVRLAACDDFICDSLDPKKYDGADEQANLKQILPSIHIANPQLRWEFGAVNFSNKAKGLATYAVSLVEEKNADGSVSRSSTNSYFAWWHNGSVFINVNIYPRGGDQTLSLSDLERRMTKSEAENALRDVFAVLEPALPR